MRRKTLANPADLADILTRTKSLGQSSRRKWGKMNVHQVICHLADSFRAATGEKQVSPESSKPKVWMKYLALQLPVRWPHGVKTRPEVDQEIGGTRPKEFETDREQLMELLNRFARQPRDFQWMPHPIFGEMNDAEWLRWGYLHMDHHLRQFGA